MPLLRVSIQQYFKCCQNTRFVCCLYEVFMFTGSKHSVLTGKTYFGF